jgi:uncharacterized protein YecA (UPF0149 family)
MGKPECRQVLGFPSLAAFIASDPDKTTLNFRRFDHLAACNLLHLQAELARLERQFDQYDQQDTKEDATLQYLRNWDEMKVAAQSDTR